MRVTALGRMSVVVGRVVFVVRGWRVRWERVHAGCFRSIVRVVIGAGVVREDRQGIGISNTFVRY